MKLQYTFTRKFFLRWLHPQTPIGPPCNPLMWRGVQSSWGINTTENKYLLIKKIIRFHNQQSSTWRLISTTPPLLYMLDSKPSWTLKISHLHLHSWRPTETEQELSFSLVTPFVNMSAGFWLVCIFSSFNCPFSKVDRMKWVPQLYMLSIRMEG